MKRGPYPSARQRKRIFERRVDLLQKVVPIMISEEAEEIVDQRLRALKEEYGEADMNAVMKILHRSDAFKLITQLMTPAQREQARYREYVSSYRRFGGDFPFLSFREFTRQLAILEEVSREVDKGMTMTVAAARYMERLSDTLYALNGFPRS